MRLIREAKNRAQSALSWGAIRLTLIAAALIGAGPAFAQQEAERRDWQVGLVPAATPVRDRIDSFHNELLIIITLITIFVLALLIYAMARFNARAHPVPSKTTHNTLLEVLWTTIPVLILVSIAVPSFKLLYYEDRTQHADMTLKVTGHQWYWSYEYPDNGDFAFDSNMLPDDKAAAAGEPRLLGVDNAVVIPVGAVVRVLISGTDVIHSWYLPAAAVQEYAVVGHTNESWMQFEREGTFYGQCNQICGVNHPFMPIEVHVVSKEAFEAWSADAKKKFAQNASPDSSPLRVAAAAQ
jgi:cytochrome c oxidase subunit 2